MDPKRKGMLTAIWKREFHPKSIRLDHDRPEQFVRCQVGSCQYQHKRAVTQSLRCCATNWKVAGSIPDGVIEIFH